jgi:leader peptidase (prepilin peptidase) / N-methyltransferase
MSGSPTPAPAKSKAMVTPAGTGIKTHRRFSRSLENLMGQTWLRSCAWPHLLALGVVPAVLASRVATPGDPARLGVAAAPLVVVLLAAAGIDLAIRRIPDWITVPGLGWAFGLHARPTAWHLTDALMGLLASSGLLLALAMLSRGQVGGGDVKLMAVIGGALGPGGGLAALLEAHLAAAFVGLTRMLSGHRNWREPVPFGPFLAGAGLLALILAW